MAITLLPSSREETIATLRSRMEQVQGGPQITTPALSGASGLPGLIQLRAGSSYRVDEASLALALLAEPSRAGAWVALVGVADLGVAAAAQFGVNLDRTVLVPDPAEFWPETTAALADVIPMIWLRPATPVQPRIARRLAARLRKRDATLLVHGDWPGYEARLRMLEERWHGAGDGHGSLKAREVSVEYQRNGGPARTERFWLPNHSGEQGVAVSPIDRPARLEAAG